MKIIKKGNIKYSVVGLGTLIQIQYIMFLGGAIAMCGFGAGIWFSESPKYRWAGLAISVTLFLIGIISIAVCAEIISSKNKAPKKK